MQAQSPNPFQEGLAAAANGDFARAEAIARMLLGRDPNDVHGLQILGFSAFRRGRNEDALRAFARANEIAPGQPAILYWLGLLLKEGGSFEKAERALAEAVRINPAYGEAYCHLGEARFQLARIDDARRAYENAVRSEPGSPVVLARAAMFFQQTHELDRARDLAERAIAIAPGDEIAHIALAEINLGRKDPVAVVEKLEPLLARPASNDRNAARLHHQLASAYDRLGRWQEAFRAYSAANSLQKNVGRERIRSEESPLTPDNLDRLIEFFSQADLKAWTRHEALDGPAPVFLLGFVRSGTTWLDQILSSHPDIVVMEEEDNFVDAWREFLLTRKGLERLKDLSAEEIDRWRAAYWRRARACLAEDPGERLVVDKVPLNTIQLGLIYRLFPEAKIIFAIRDPRDSVLSAFQQHFHINTAMYQFLELETAAAFYDKVMTLGEIIRAKTPLAVHEIRYEELVMAFEEQTRRLTDFLNLPWTEAMLAYDQTAKQRAIRTPSAPQVIQKPYTSSIKKWRNYQEQMRPALPLLDRWASKFGYEPSGEDAVQADA